MKKARVGSACDAASNGLATSSGSAVLAMTTRSLQVNVTSALAALKAEPAVRFNGCPTGAAACTTMISIKAGAINRHGPRIHWFQITIAPAVAQDAKFVRPRSRSGRVQAPGVVLARARTCVGDMANQRLQRRVITDCSAKPSLSEIHAKSETVSLR